MDLARWNRKATADHDHRLDGLPPGDLVATTGGAIQMIPRK